MATEDNNNLQLPTSITQELIASQASLNNAVQQMMRLQAATLQATFDALPMDQRDVFCQSLRNEYTPNEIAELTGKSYPTVNRHLNGKNS